MNRRSMRKGRSFLAVAGSVVLLLLSLDADARDENVLQRYPSPEEWLRRAEELKRADPAAYAATRLDFDLAIRSVYCLQAPRVGEPRNQHVADRWPRLVPVPTRREILETIPYFKGQPGFEEFEAFMLEHLDERVVEDTPRLKIVLAEVLINGWDEWSAWGEHEMLREVRDQFPFVHRYEAWQLADKYDMLDFVGLALRYFNDEDRFAQDCGGIEHIVSKACDLELLGYLLQRWQDMRTGFPFVSIGSGMIVQPEQHARVRDVWAKYLNSPVDILRAEAVTQTGEMIRRIRRHSRGQENSDNLQEKLRLMAQTDPSGDVRRRAQRGLEDIQNTEWNENP